MANFIYNVFMKSIATNGIDLTKKNTYKICLLKEDFADILNSDSRETDNNDNYTTISLSGYECRDTGRYTGYVQGGEYITLTKNDLYKSDNTVEYYFNDRITWYKVTLVDEDMPRYILLYREGDGQAIGCFDLGGTTEFKGDDLTIDWGTNPVIRINTSDEESSIDSFYSLSSNKSLQNKVVTQGLMNYGVAIGEEKVDLPETHELQIDTLNRIEDSTIESMFNED